MLIAEIQRDVEDAIDEFESTINCSDLKTFQEISLEDVRKTLHIIEREREHTGKSVNLRRIEKLLGTIHLLANILEKSSLKISYLCYLWAPIKCMLQIADRSDSSLKDLLNAYSLLNSHISTPDTTPLTEHQNQSVFGVAAYFLIDVLDFHRITYQILRRGGWLILFDSAWKHVRSQFDGIFQRLEKSRGLGKRLLTDDEWTIFRYEREKILDQQKCRQVEQDDRQLKLCLLWLGTGTQEQVQENLFDRRADAREDGTCKWILGHPKFISWLDPDHTQPFLWVNGKPGSGKTTLATFIIQKAEFPLGSVALRCLCSREIFEPSEDPCNFVLRYLITQILRQHSILVAIVYEEYVRNAETPSLQTMSVILRRLLLCLPATYMIIDGLDECELQHQQQILAKIDFLLQLRKDEGFTRPELKVLVCSRDTRDTPARLQKEPMISMTAEDSHVSNDIRIYTHNNVKVLCEKFNQHAVDKIKTDIVVKAKGMFLWVKLIISVLLSQQSLHGLQTTLNHLPSGLTGIYTAIMKRIGDTLDDRAKQHVQAIFTWMTFCRRPLKIWELCDALVFDSPDQTLTEQTVLNKAVVDLCKPLVEEYHDGTVAFVHFSVQEFLLHRASGPYLETWKAERAISVSCFRYLLTCNTFFESEESARSFAAILRGFHSLFPYVNQFWSSHLASCFTHEPEIEKHRTAKDYGDVVIHSGALIQGDSYFINVGDQPACALQPNYLHSHLGIPNVATHITQKLTSRRQDLEWLYASIVRYEGHSNLMGEAVENLQIQSQNSYPYDGRYQATEPFQGFTAPRRAVVPNPKSLIEQVMDTARVAWSSFPHATETSVTFEPNENPISRAFLSYQKQLEMLVENRCPYSIAQMSVSEQDLQEFQSRYAIAAYLCRWKGCTRSNLGFNCRSDREKHEKLHVLRFYCPEPDCEFSHNGLASQAALKAHVRKYHSRNVEVPIPKFRSRQSQKSHVTRNLNTIDHYQQDNFIQTLPVANTGSSNSSSHRPSNTYITQPKNSAYLDPTIVGYVGFGTDQEGWKDVRLDPTNNQLPLLSDIKKTVSTSPAGLASTDLSYEWFYDHFKFSAQRALSTKTNQPCEDFLRDLWEKLIPENRGMLQRLSEYIEVIRDFSWSNDFLGFTEIATISNGMHAYSQFYHGASSLMSVRPELWLRGDIFEHVENMWQVLQDEERKELTNLRGSWQPPSRLRGLAHGVDPIFSTPAFRERFMLRKLVDLGFECLKTTPGSIIPIEKWLYGELSLGLLHCYGTLTLACFVRVICLNLTSEELEVVRRHIQDSNNAVAAISAKSLWIGLEYCLGLDEIYEPPLGPNDNSVARSEFTNWIIAYQPSFDMTFRKYLDWGAHWGADWEADWALLGFQQRRAFLPQKPWLPRIE